MECVCNILFHIVKLYPRFLVQLHFVVSVTCEPLEKQPFFCLSLTEKWFVQIWQRKAQSVLNWCFLGPYLSGSEAFIDNIHICKKLL